MSNYKSLRGLSALRSGRRAQPMKATNHKAGAVAVVVSSALFIAGCSAPVLNEVPAQAPTTEETPTATAKAPPSAAPTAEETQAAGAPLDPEVPAAAAKGMAVAAPKSQPDYATKALDLLATLPIKGRAPKTGYDRELFGQAWADVDRNGCDTRNDILKRDLTSIGYVNSVPCKVRSGILADPYTGTSISFLRGSTTSILVQIDHVVALSDAWQKGAQQLTLQQRTSFANDPLNLQATDGPTNQQKGDGDAATWLPPNKGFRCEYVARQISVKATYSLWVTQAEHDAMARILGNCDGQLAPTRAKSPAPIVAQPAPATIAPAPAPVAPAPAPAPVAPAPAPVAPAPVAVYYPNCAAARAAGAAPLCAGVAGYRAGLDRDRDGVACE